MFPTWGIPGFVTVSCVAGFRYWHQTFLKISILNLTYLFPLYLVYPGISGLVKGVDTDIEAGVLPDDLVSVLICIEAVHEDQRHVGRVLLVEELNLLNCQVQEGQI